MEAPGGCCLLRYAGDADVASKVEWIMLRFRPIAPKPVSPGESPPSSSLATEGGESTRRAKVRGAVVRRRGRREGVGRRGRKRRASRPEERVTKRVMTRKDLVTLQLMPEMPERKETTAAAASVSAPLPDLARSYAPRCPEGPGTVMAPTAVWSAESWLTLESVTETCQLAGEERGRCTRAEARRALEGDACPAFLSDACDWVAWTNAAYRKMVGLGDEGGAVSAALETRGRVPTGVACGGFSCRARVTYACSTTGEKGSMTVPCDVWRLAEDGWLAWRLDVKAALRLGR